MKRLALILLASVGALFSEAQEVSDLPRPIVQQYRLAVGSSDALSTYLSPLRYTGTAVTVSGQWSKAFNRHPGNMVMDFNTDFTLRELSNTMHTAVMEGLDMGFSWGLAWRKRLPHSLQVTAGGAARISGGALYLTRNGNNPVTALATAGVDLTASLSWRTKLKRIPVIISDRLSIPTLGAFFSPQYGETYYEIWLGNHKGLAHCGWWGNNFGLRNHLAATFDFGRTAWEIGYRFDRQSYHANNLTTVINTHQIVVGVIPYGLGIRRPRNINSPLY